MPRSLPTVGRLPLRRSRRFMRGLSLAAIVLAAAAVWLAARGAPDGRVQLLLAAALGSGFCVLLGAAVMTFGLASSGPGPGEQAPPSGRASEEDEI